ncbi:MAG: ABC transporter permease subunit, partial [Acidobacteriota bacterium]|nr:ABC transporter permease subunit [Acidobacteriota bacterium]
MLSFIIRRLLIIIPMALLVVTLTWGLIRIAPGNFYSSEKKLPPAIEANIKKKYGLDKEWYQQYGIMMLNIVQLDFGESLKYQGQSVNEIIKRHFPYSATVGLLAYILALFLGLTAGIIAALKQNSAFDYGSMSAAMLGLSVPNFVLGPILVLVFSLWIYIFPPARWGGFMSLVLPVVTLAMIYAAYIARLTRAGMLEVMRSD